VGIKEFLFFLTVRWEEKCTDRERKENE